MGHQAALVTLTGNAELVHCPNVNTKEAELVVPVNRVIEVNKSVENDEQYMEIVLPANSLSVVVLDLK